MNILIAMAGLGQRFKAEGYKLPKPLIDVLGRPMIEKAIDSLGLQGNFIFIIPKLEDENARSLLYSVLTKYASPSNIIVAEELTEGPVCSALLARDLINNQDELIVSNCDVIMNWDSSKFSNFVKKVQADSIVITFNSDNPAFSYIKVDDSGRATQLAEKKVISEHALNGIHYFRQGSDFVKASDEIIKKNIRVNNEFYVSLSINELVEQGKFVTNYSVSKTETWSTGTPLELEHYLKKFRNKLL